MKSWCEAVLNGTGRAAGAAGAVSAGPGAIERETPYCYGVNWMTPIPKHKLKRVNMESLLKLIFAAAQLPDFPKGRWCKPGPPELARPGQDKFMELKREDLGDVFRGQDQGAIEQVLSDLQ